ncbi:MAG: galactosyldiacylglycerol synthase [Anaerolineales bacterium]|nr:galactosyldiacylglycerol synthase [Anaerolineales bacterium]
MNNPDNNTLPRILFLFSDTGGGHRSAAEAIIEAIHIQYGDHFIIQMVDIFKEYAPLPLNYMPELYPKMVKVPSAWGLGYRATNSHRRARILTGSAYPYVRRSIRNLVRDNPCDVIVSVHPLAAAPILRTLKNKKHPPFITVVTDLVTTHALWYHHLTDLCVVPTEIARQRAIIFGMDAEKVRVIGLPVSDRFCVPPGDSTSIKKELGWPVNKPVILLVGGGEGMGPLEKTAIAISEAGLPASLVVITGRNIKLKERLQATNFQIPTFIYGFVKEMPEFMRGADILVTKAGPGTICEALNAGLPMILYSRLPGQEDGNVTYVVNEGAGLWAPTPQEIVAGLSTWLYQPEQRQIAAQACRRIARPQAARQIAQIIIEQLGHSKTITPDER